MWTSQFPQPIQGTCLENALQWVLNRRWECLVFSCNNGQYSTAPTKLAGVKLKLPLPAAGKWQSPLSAVWRYEYSYLYHRLNLLTNNIGKNRGKKQQLQLCKKHPGSPASFLTGSFRRTDMGPGRRKTLGQSFASERNSVRWLNTAQE